LGCLRPTADHVNYVHVNHDHDTNNDDDYHEFEHGNHEHNLIEYDHHDAAELRALVSRCVYPAAAARPRLLADPVPELPCDLHRPATRSPQLRGRPRRNRMRKLRPSLG
jgi:hypothetical protein